MPIYWQVPHIAVRTGGGGDFVRNILRQALFTSVLVADSAFRNSCYCFSLAKPMLLSCTRGLYCNKQYALLFHCACAKNPQVLIFSYGKTKVVLVVFCTVKHFVSTNWTCPHRNLTCWCLESMNAGCILISSFLRSSLCQPAFWLTLVTAAQSSYATYKAEVSVRQHGL